MKPPWKSASFHDPWMEAIFHSPEEDGPRFEAAKQLDASGQPVRAEFVRVQLERTQAERSFEPGRFHALGVRENELFGRLEPDPIADELRARGATRVMYGRGFVDGIEIDTELFLAQFYELRALAPLLRLRLTSAGQHISELTSSGVLASVVALDLTHNHLGDDGIKRLLGTIPFTRLTWLDLRWNGIGLDGLRAIAKETQRILPRLQWLHVSGVDFRSPCDESIDEDGRLIDWLETDLGRELESQFGELRWLHYRPKHLRFFPPSMTHFVGT